MKSIEEQLAKVNEQIEAKKKQRSQLKAQARSQERKADTRRKIIIGAAVESIFKNATGGLWMKEGEKNNSRSIKEVLSRVVTDKSDRKFLGLDD